MPVQWTSHRHSTPPSVMVNTPSSGCHRRRQYSRSRIPRDLIRESCHATSLQFAMGGLVWHVLLIDNYDSFTYNRFQAPYFLSVTVRRNDTDTSMRWAPVESSGCFAWHPGKRFFHLIHSAGARRLPILGICLTQCPRSAGGQVVRAAQTHGKTSNIVHDQKALFADVLTP